MKRVLLAATRLAALYALGVIVMALGLSALSDYSLGTLTEFLTTAPILIGVCFAIGFVLLAVARRVGFAILWLVVLATWVFVMRAGLEPLVILPAFPVWTVFAVPLYVLTAVGLGAPSDRPPRLSWLRFEIPVTLLAWLGAVVVCVLFSVPFFGSEQGPLYGPPQAQIATYVCTALPFVIGTRELVRIVLAVRPSGRHAAEQGL